MAVVVVSSTLARVLSPPPPRLVSISRLRRLAASMTTVSSRLSTPMAVTWGRALRWVSLA